MLAEELKNDFSHNFCLKYDGKNSEQKERDIINTLDEKTNRFRAIFAVDMLSEGWDVLSLFDIVRLYETYDSKNDNPGKSTISEAQLIGRGARLAPFKVSEEQDKFRRKYDFDLENPFRICEEMYYHCQNDSRYIAELKNACREIGIIGETKSIEHNLKESFKNTELYKKGFVFANEKIRIDQEKILGKLQREYRESVKSRQIKIEHIFENDEQIFEFTEKKRKIKRRNF
jgi:type III restriction enzyme